MLEGLLAEYPGNQAYRFELATALKQRSWRAPAGKLEFARRAVDLYQGLLDEDTANVSFREGLIDGLRTQMEGPDSENERALVQRLRQLIDPPEINKRVLAYAYVKFAGVGAKNGDLEEAEKSCRTAVELLREDHAEHPTDLRTREHLSRESKALGDFLVQRGNREQAVAAYDEAFCAGNALRRDFPAMRLFRTETDGVVRALIGNLLKLQRTDEATTILNELAMQYAPDYVFRAGQFERLRQPDKSQQDVERAVMLCEAEIKADPTDDEAWQTRGDLRTSLKQFEPALEDYLHAWRLNQNSTEGFFKCIDAFKALGQVKEANSFCQAAS